MKLFLEASSFRRLSAEIAFRREVARGVLQSLANSAGALAGSSAALLAAILSVSFIVV